MHLCHVAFDEAAFCCKAKVQHVIKKKEEKKEVLPGKWHRVCDTAESFQSETHHISW